MASAPDDIIQGMPAWRAFGFPDRASYVAVYGEGGGAPTSNWGQTTGRQILYRPGGAAGTGPAPAAPSTPAADATPPPDPAKAAADAIAKAAADAAAAAKAQRQRDAMDMLNQTFAQYDLPGLGEWAWGELQAGSSMDKILLDMYNQPIFKQKYPMVDAMRAEGMSVPTLAEIRTTMNDYKRLQRAYGHDVSNNPQGYVALFTGRVAPSEFEKRLDNYDKLRNVYGPHLRAAFEQHANIPGVSDEQLYTMLSGQNPQLAQQYAKATGNDVTHLTFESIENAFNRSIEEEKAGARAGGDIAGGIGATEEDRILRERQLAI